MTPNPVLERLATNIWREPYASDGKIDGVFQPARRMAKSRALEKPNIQINGPRLIRYLSFDIDRRLGALAWDDANLPPPNIIVINQDNLHAHLIYELEKPIWKRTENDRRPGEAPPVRYCNAVWKGMRRDLKADPGYTGLMVKNPFNAQWRTVVLRSRPYRLAELAAHLDLDDNSDCDIRDNPDGRNCTLFDSIRYWAYRSVKDYSDRESFKLALSDELDRLNQSLRNPLPGRETNDIAKSVSRWVWTKYDGCGKARRRGIMHLDPRESLRARQQQGQAYTCTLRIDSTMQKIASTIRSLLLAHKPVTKSAVASICQLHRNTVARYWDRCFPHSLPVIEEETVSLRDKSLSLPPVGASAGYPEPTQCSTPLVARPKITGTPETFELVLLPAIDKWRNQRDFDEQRTTQ